MSELQKTIDELKAKLDDWEVNHRDCKVTLVAGKKTTKGKKVTKKINIYFTVNNSAVVVVV